MPILKIRVHHQLQGGHVHMRVFGAIVPKTGYDHGYTLGKCGDLVMRDDEFAMFRGALDRARPNGGTSGLLEVEFVERQEV
jgi:hypothetical protein